MFLIVDILLWLLYNNVVNLLGGVDYLCLDLTLVEIVLELV